MKILLHIWIIICLSSGIYPVNQKIQPQHIEITRKHSVMDKKILVIYHDPTHRLHILTKRIDQKLQVTLCDLEDEQVLDAKDFDLIILGDIASSDDVSDEMKHFLSWYDFQEKQVSAYFLDAMHQDEYEENLKRQLRHGNYLNGFGINDDELENMEEVNHIMDGWLTSTYSPVSYTNQQ